MPRSEPRRRSGRQAPASPVDRPPEAEPVERATAAAAEAEGDDEERGGDGNGGGGGGGDDGDDGDLGLGVEDGSLDQEVVTPPPSPGSYGAPEMRFGGAAQPGAAENRMPPYPPPSGTSFDGMFPGVGVGAGGGAAPGAGRAAYQDGDGGDDVADRASPPTPSYHDGQEAAVAQQLWAEYPSDVIIDLRVRQENTITHELVERGRLYAIPMGRARCPETYLEFGGDYWLDTFSNETGKKLGNSRHVRMPGEEPPDDWRVGMDIKTQVQQAVAAALGQQGFQVVQPPQGWGGQVPGPIFTGQMNQAWGQFQGIQQKVDLLEAELRAERAARAQDAIRSEMREQENRVMGAIRELKSEIGGGGNRGAWAIAEKAIDASMNRQDSSSSFVEFFKATMGPEAKVAEANISLAVVEAMSKMVKASQGDGFDISKLTSAYEKHLEFEDKRRRDQIAWMEKEEEKKTAKAKAKAEEDAKTKAADAKSQRSSKTIDGMLEVIVNAMRSKRHPSEVAELINTLVVTVIRMGWAEFDDSIKEMLRDLRYEPHKGVATFARHAGMEKPSDEQAAYLAATTLFFAKAAGLTDYRPPQAQQPAPEAAAAAAQASPAGPAAPAAPQPPPAEPKAPEAQAPVEGPPAPPAQDQPQAPPQAPPPAVKPEPEPAAAPPSDTPPAQ